MDDSLSGRPRSRRPWSRRIIASHRNGSTLPVPSTSPLPAESAQTPFVSQERWFSFVARFFRWRTPTSAAQTSETSPVRSWFKRLVSSRKAPPAEQHGPSSVQAPPDPAASCAAPHPEAPDAVLVSSEVRSTIPEPPAIPPKSPPEQAQEALERAGRLSPGSASSIERVPGTWEATSSTAESWEGVASKISAFAGIVDAIGDVHPYVKAATTVITGIVKPIVAQSARDDKFDGLLKEMTYAYDCVIREAGSVARLKEQPATRQTELLEAICRESEQCARFIEEQYIRTFWERAARNTFSGGEVDRKVDQYRSNFASLRTRWQEEVVHQLKGDMVLDKLARLQHAGPPSQRACMADTRVFVLEKIFQWIDCPDSPRVLFLLGVAGSGKTSIANTVAELGHKRAMLGSFFAFNRNDSARSPETLLGTIAHQLARNDETYRDWLVKILKDDVMLADSPDIMRQWRQLIVEPAASMSSSGPVLVVIDAFDECPELSDNTRQRLLDCLTLHASELPDRFRVLVTSRPLEKVSQAMTLSSVGRLDLSDFSAVGDICRYVRSQLPPPHEGGLSDEDCQAVADAAEGLFQWAATACRFLAHRLSGTTMSARLRDNRQQIIHGVTGRIQRRNGPPSLDELYAAVLEDAFDVEDMKVMANFRCAVAAMLCTGFPVSIDVLQSIYERARPSSLGVIKSVLGCMGVVLEGASSPSSPVRPMHLSFREFLCSASRGGIWHVRDADIAHGHRILALGGLRIMARDLQFNMHPALPMFYVPPTKNWRKENNPHPALAYTTSELHRHLAQVLQWGIGARNCTLFCRAWQRLLYNKLIFWMEWAAVRGGFWEDTREALELAVKMLKGKDRRFAKDAYRYHDLLRNLRVITASSIYLSGLTFAPTDSLPSWICYEEVYVKTVPRMAWSTDCRYIRADSDSEDLRSSCWDARTGDAVDLPPDMGWRYASAASADGCIQVTISRDEDGELLAHVERCPIDTAPAKFTIYTEFHWDDGYHVDVSPDGNWLAMCTDGHGGPGLWNLETGEDAYDNTVEFLIIHNVGDSPKAMNYEHYSV